MKKTPLKRQSKKQRVRNKMWHDLFIARLEAQIKERGYTYCEGCGLHGDKDDPNEWRQLDPHHVNHHREDNTDHNLEVLHRIPCHVRHHGVNIKEV